MIATTSEPETMLKPASTIVRYDPDEPIRVPFEINGVVHHLTNAEIQAHMERVEILAKVAEEERMSKPALIKVVHEEAEKFGLDTEALANEQAGAAFKKARKNS
jgi:CMP-2-keto-3-deoxyoctulosonic acid synthetase